MNKLHLLSAVALLALGFLLGYLSHEVVVARQPPRRPPGTLFPGETLPAEAGGAPGAAAAPQAAAGQGGGAGQAAPAMEEIRALRDHVAKNPNDADAVIRLANLNFDIQNWARARELYEQYLRLRPDQPDVLSDLGVTLRELGDPQGAVALFDRAQQIEPDHWQSRFNEVVVLAFDLQDYAAAEAVIAELKRLQPGNQDVARLEAEVARRRAA